MVRKFIALSVIAVAVLLTSGCAAVAEGSGVASKTVTLKNGGSVECVVVAGTDGGLSVDCIDSTYTPSGGD